MSEYHVALVSGGLAIAGTLLGVIFTYRLAIKSADRQFQHLRDISKMDALHAAGRELVQAFAQELAVLDGREELPVELDVFLLRAHHAKHKTAIAAFRSHLDVSRRGAFDAACKQYHCEQTAEDMMEVGVPRDQAMFFEYMNGRSQGDPYQLAAERIHAILSFAKPE